MIIELKNLYFDRRQIVKRTPFKANVMVNQRLVGEIERRKGKAVKFWIEDESKHLIEEANRWCIALPAKEIEGKSISFSSLKDYARFLADREIKRTYELRLFIDSLFHIIIGKPGVTYRWVWSFPEKIEYLLLLESGRNKIVDAIREIRWDMLRPGEKILNPNIPPEIIARGMKPVKAKSSRKAKIIRDKENGKQKGI